MIRDEELLPLLATIAEGDVITTGKLLKGVSDESIAWVVIEVAHLHSKTRITLHAYWQDIFLVSKVVSINDRDEIHWGATKV